MTEQQMNEKFIKGKGFYNDKQYEGAVLIFMEIAQAGYADAQFMMGICCAGGHGAEKSEAEAARWFGKAADQGSANAQNELGVFYQLGAGVEQNLEKAVESYSMAAEQGHAEAKNVLNELEKRKII
ncbi:MAG: sel1 repeat family protein [Treponema sp.]|jgi:TPR repeat protein|nr:sel1 repeat family protein [Treponema sp.]